MAVTHPNPTMLARMMASRAVDGSAFRVSQLRTAMPAQGPPKLRRKSIYAVEGSCGTAPIPNCRGTSITPSPTTPR
jgi:hypothetical protein